MKIEVMLERLGSVTPATLADVVALSDAYGSLGLAMGLVEMGEATLDYATSSREEGVLKVTAATLMYTYADQMVDQAEDALELGMGDGKAPLPKQEQVRSLAELFRRAAEANLNYFDNVVLTEFSQETGLHIDVVKNIFAYQDTTYLFAYAAARAMEPMKKRTRGDTATTYATLGGALNSYVSSSMLVARYYSLGLKRDKEGNVDGVENEQAMGHMLDFAEQRAQEIMGLAAAAGDQLVGPVLSYEAARADREGDIQAKLTALTGYWSAALHGQMIGILTGKARVLG
jgi:hypothetical protein